MQYYRVCGQQHLKKFLQLLDDSRSSALILLCKKNDGFIEVRHNLACDKYDKLSLVMFSARSTGVLISYFVINEILYKYVLSIGKRLGCSTAVWK